MSYDQELFKKRYNRYLNRSKKEKRVELLNKLQRSFVTCYNYLCDNDKTEYHSNLSMVTYISFYTDYQAVLNSEIFEDYMMFKQCANLTNLSSIDDAENMYKLIDEIYGEFYEELYNIHSFMKWCVVAEDDRDFYEYNKDSYVKTMNLLEKIISFYNNDPSFYKRNRF
ncbi:hypothetical protein COI93_24115 [Bacillus cereus]|uniref:Uncharacterized protein n=1 Tax=Bacillus cereus TaxID=1396 RepID=A0A2B0LHG4_BACCE|nr:hypothetical protein COI93_24115 [Bacillus cereus]